jgi:hypothetical protein
MGDLGGSTTELGNQPGTSGINVWPFLDDKLNPALDPNPCHGKANSSFPAKPFEGRPRTTGPHGKDGNGFQAIALHDSRLLLVV